MDISSCSYIGTRLSTFLSLFVYVDMMETLLCLFLIQCVRVCGAMLDQGLPLSPTVSVSEAAYLHQILNQESSLRIELEKQMTSLHSTVFTLQQEMLKLKAENQDLRNDSKAGKTQYKRMLVNIIA